jgi:hypothetical protein
VKIPVIFSTVTGNAVKLAFAAAGALDEPVGPYNVGYVLGDERHNVKFVTDFVTDKYDAFVIVYWCDLGTADRDTLELISRMRGKSLIVLGTLGVTVDSKHAADVKARVEAAVNKENKLLCHYLCQGAVDISRTVNKLKTPENESGTLSEEGFARHLRSQGHPDAAEIEAAARAVREALSKL